MSMVLQSFLLGKYTKEVLSDSKSGCRDQIVVDTAKNEKIRKFYMTLSLFQRELIELLLR
ncbi:hypothetical protein RhiirC2_788289 [Rhizophagus irregularis]|uniref:Uncharacterized protein n=1 Tax=Rhizophagus irregularis TaxID=588596 RepID=A0A2N1MQE6_9GLOM|nr:hypothetical protein RhiirC2_788289 [Rhizophagus irregularis]